MIKVRLIIVDDDIIWLEQLIKLLSFENDMEVIAATINREDAFDLSKKLMPDLVLMDVNLSGNVNDKNSGILAALSIIQELKINVIMLSSISEEEVIRNSFFTGALQYVDKKNIQHLPSTIRSCVTTANSMSILLSEVRRLKREELLNVLSTEERNVFDQFDYGYCTKEVEAKLLKSKNTVRNQIKSINKKLKVANISEAVSKVRSFFIANE